MRVIENPLAGFGDCVVGARRLDQIVTCRFERLFVLVELRENVWNFGRANDVVRVEEDAWFTGGAKCFDEFRNLR